MTKRTGERRQRKPDCHCSIPMTVVVFLGAIATVLSVGVLFLLWQGKTPDAALYTMAGGAIGSLGTMLSNTRPQTAQGAAPGPTTNISTGPGGSASVAAPDVAAADDAPGADQ